MKNVLAFAIATVFVAPIAWAVYTIVLTWQQESRLERLCTEAERLKLSVSDEQSLIKADKLASSAMQLFKDSNNSSPRSAVAALRAAEVQDSARCLLAFIELGRALKQDDADEVRKVLTRQVKEIAYFDANVRYYREIANPSAVFGTDCCRLNQNFPGHLGSSTIRSRRSESPYEESFKSLLEYFYEAGIPGVKRCLEQRGLSHLVR